MFPKGNLNRIWVVLGALDSLEKTTLVNITKACGMPKASVNDVLIKLIDGQVAGVKVEKIGKEYHIAEWTNFRKKINEIYSNSSCKVG